MQDLFIYNQIQRDSIVVIYLIDYELYVAFCGANTSQMQT